MGAVPPLRLRSEPPPPPPPPFPLACPPPQVRSVLEEGLWDTMRKYGEDVPLTEAVDKLQEDVSSAGLGAPFPPFPPPHGLINALSSQFHCCGANNYTDWATLERFRANNTVPRSCCRVNTTTCNINPTPSTIYEEVRPPPP